MNPNDDGTVLGATRCRCCRATRMVDFLDLGVQPIANRYVAVEDRDAPEPHFPLHAFVCLDCALIQVPNRVPASFFRHYLYVPSSSDALAAHFEQLAERVVSAGFVPNDGYLVDIGCNEGVLLSACARRGVQVVGVDPARNLIEAARGRGIDVVGEYFDREVARALVDERGPASVVTCTNTFNHIDDLVAFVLGVGDLLASDGVFIVEVPHAGELIENNQFDTIYHEHLSEFSVASMVALLSACDLCIFDVEALAVHGGSMRVFAQRTGGKRVRLDTVDRWLADEARRGLFEAHTYEAFRARVLDVRHTIRDSVRALRAGGRSVAAYGAPAKGMTLLSYCGFTTDDIAYVVDRSTLKQGRLTPGTHIPIVSSAHLAHAPPDVLLLLAWNYLDEVVLQQATFLEQGGRLFVPIPTPRYVDAKNPRGVWP